jgi:hypothetical protein
MTGFFRETHSAVCFAGFGSHDKRAICVSWTAVFLHYPPRLTQKTHQSWLRNLNSLKASISTPKLFRNLFLSKVPSPLAAGQKTRLPKTQASHDPLCFQR